MALRAHITSGGSLVAWLSPESRLQPEACETLQRWWRAADCWRVEATTRRVGEALSAVNRLAGFRLKPGLGQYSAIW